MSTKKISNRQKIHYRIRKKVKGTADRPRFSVFRSNKEIYGQLIDDSNGNTLIAASSRDAEVASNKGAKVDLSKHVGSLLAQRAKDAGIETVVFDRSGYLYHGRVKALAEGAREGGLQF